jgi:pilus assembly protein Flp/PilA
MIQFLKIMLEGKKAEMDERGATAVEYGLLVALIAAVIVTVVVTLGQNILGGFQTVTDNTGPAAP